MLQNHQDILNCLRRHQIADLTKFNFDTPSFLSAMGPSRDGVLIPADFGTSVIIRKRAHSTHYQVRKGISSRPYIISCAYMFLRFFFELQELLSNWLPELASWDVMHAYEQFES